jgi:hypothetical protein
MLKLVDTLTEDEFLKYVKGEEFAVKLSNEEMSFLQGGADTSKLFSGVKNKNTAKPLVFTHNIWDYGTCMYNQERYKTQNCYLPENPNTFGTKKDKTKSPQFGAPGWGAVDSENDGFKIVPINKPISSKK